MNALVQSIAAPAFLPTVESFDYSMVSKSDAAELRRGAVDIRTRLAKTKADFIEMGRVLADAKARLIENGKFTIWVEREIGVNVRTAQFWMSLARLAKERGETVSLLPLRTMRRLAQKSAPPVVVDEIMKQAAAGVVMPDVAVVEMIADVRRREREAERERAATSTPAKRRRRAHDRRNRAEQQASGQRQQETARDTAIRINDGLGSDGVRLLLAELNSSPNMFIVIEQLRMLVVDREGGA